MLNKKNLGKIVRFVIVSLCGLAVMRRILPESWIAFVQSEEGLGDVVEIAVALITLVWSLYRGVSDDVGLELAASKPAGTTVEEVKQQTAQIPVGDKLAVAIKGVPVEEVIARQEAKND